MVPAQGDCCRPGSRSRLRSCFPRTSEGCIASRKEVVGRRPGAVASLLRTLSRLSGGSRWKTRLVVSRPPARPPAGDTPCVASPPWSRGVYYPWSDFPLPPLPRPLPPLALGPAACRQYLDTGGSPWPSSGAPEQRSGAPEHRQRSTLVLLDRRSTAASGYCESTVYGLPRKQHERAPLSRLLGEGASGPCRVAAFGLPRKHCGVIPEGGWRLEANFWP